MAVAGQDSEVASESKVSSALSRLPGDFFGPASEVPERRRASDWIRVAVGVVVFSLLLWHHNHESLAEKDVFRALHALPQGAASALHLFYSLGALWAVVLVASCVALTFAF